MTSSSSNETSRVAHRASRQSAPPLQKAKVAIIGLVTIAMVAALMQLAIGDRADAAGPPYAGPVTAATGPAYFGPAPNPLPYCETPVYFDPFPENVNPQGLITVDGAPNASVTTQGVTLDFELTADGPDPDYPGFFDAANTGRSANDQPKGLEMAAGDAATITLSEPLFYTQWVFTDVDRANEGFDIVPVWTDPANPGAVAVFGGNTAFDFLGSTVNLAQFNDTDTVGEDSESINGRAQVDLLSAVTGITITRDPGSGQSGFAVGGGCAPIGVAKEVSSGPTWNGSSFDVSYTIRVRNNLPSSATLSADTAAAVAAAASGEVFGTPVGIDLTNVTLQDLLIADEFASVTVVSNTNASGSVATNPDYDGDTDVNLILAGETIAPETTEEFELVLQYVPAPMGPLDPGVCVATFDLLNSAVAAGTAAGVEVQDESDEGDNADPGNPNGGGDVDDPTVVTFDCPPQDEPDLEIVKTVVAGPNGTCPDFAGGEPGDGTALPVVDGGVATYCISVRNVGPGDATNVVVTDPQAPATFDGTIGTVAGNSEVVPALTYDVTVTDATPLTNTATVNGDGPSGALAPEIDTAVISLVQLPVLEIVKTVVPGPAGTCPAFDAGVPGLGDALEADEGDTVTYCISVRNTGTGDATNVVVSDPQAPAGFDGSLGTVAAQTEAPTLSFDLVITDTTPTTNTASVNGDGPNGPVGPVEDSALIDPISPPALEIVKTVVPGPAGTCPAFDAGVIGPGTPLEANEGDTVTYCISVRNVGGADATNVVVTDAQAPASFDGAIGTIAGGAEAPAVSYDIVVTDTTPTTNTVTATGDGPNGPIDPVDDVAVIDPIAPPALEIVKTVVPGPNGACPAFDAGVVGPGTPLEADEGDTVTYCISVRNTGGADATNVVVTDAQAPASFDGAIGTIAGGTEAPAVSYDIVVTDTTPTTNTATATGDGPNGPVDPVDDTAVIDPIAPPALEIIKTVVAGPGGTCPDFAGGIAGAGDPLEIVFGDTVTYCVSVRNVGGAAATDVVVTDPQAPAGFDGTIGTIAAGAEAPALSYDVLVTSTTPQTNTATATGNGPNFPIDPIDDIAIIDAVGTPILEIVKTVVPGPNGTCPAFAGGVLGGGAPLETVFGDTVTYCISVRNTGDGDAINVAVTDPQAPATFDGAVGTVAAGTEATPALSYDVLITETTPEINTATATGDGPRGPIDPVTDTALIDAVGTPVLEVVKTVVPGPNGVCPDFAGAVVGPGAALETTYGDTVTYCISVRNTGDGPASNVVVADPQAPASFDGTIGTIAPQTEVVPALSYDIVVDATTPETNTATATGDDPRGNPITPADDSAVIDAEGTPVLEIVKTVVPGPNGVCPAFDGGVAGIGTPLVVDWRSTVTYCISVRNTGDGPASNVVVTDAQAPASFVGAIGTIIEGTESTPALSYDLVVDENSPAINTAVANGDDPRGTPLNPVDDSAEIVPPAAPVPGIEITKTVVNAAGTCAAASEGVDEFVVGEIGGAFTWCFTVRNTGETALTTILLDDALAGLSGVDVLANYGGGVPALAIGGSIDFELPSAFPDDGAFNTVDVSGVPSESDGTVIAGLPTVDDTNTAAVGETSVTLVKTVAVGADADCATAVQAVVTRAGEPVTYCFTITNTGSVHLLVPEVVDNDLNLVIDVPAAQQVIPPGATTTVSVTASATTLINNATVTGTPTTAGGTPIPGSPTPTATDDAEVTGLTPQLDIVKTVIAGPNGTCPLNVGGGVVGAGTPLAVNVGDTVTYCMNVVNSGDVAIANVVVTDAMAPAGFDGAVGDLDVGAEGVVQFDLVVTTDSVPVNTASVTGDDPIAGGQLPPKDDTAVIDPADPAPAVTLSKTVVAAGGDCADAVEGVDELVVLEEGDAITWCFVVTNTGNVPLTDLTFDDAPAELDNVDVLATYGTPPVLPVDGVIRFSLDGTIPANGVDNVATVTGLGAELDGAVIAGLDPVDDEDTAAINETALELQKTVAEGDDADCATAVEKVTVNKGETVTYCFTLTNTGGVNVKVTEVVDDVLGVTVPVPAADQILTPGDVVTVKVSQASTGDLVNTASVAGVPVDDLGVPIPGAPLITPEDTAEVDTLEANVSVVKSIDDRGPHPVDTVVTYTFIVLNEGPDPAEDVTVVDTLPAGMTIESLPSVDGWACTRTSDTMLECAKGSPLAVDSAQTFSYTAKVTSAAASNTNLVNTVKVDSSTPDPNPDDNEDTEITERDDPQPPPPPPPPPTAIDYPTFTPPSVPVPVTPPLAITGSQTSVLATLSAALLGVGGMLAVGARRRRNEHDDLG